MKIQEIRAKAKDLGLKNTFGLSKAELIRKIQKAEGNFDCFGTAKGYCDQFQCCFRDDCFKLVNEWLEGIQPYAFTARENDKEGHYGKADPMGKLTQ